MNPFANIILVFLLIGLVWLMAKTVVVVYDALSDIFNEPLHPAKQVWRGAVAALGIGLIAALAYLFHLILAALNGPSV